MMVLMNQDATELQIDEVMERIEQHKMQALRLPGDDHVAIGVASSIPPDLREPLTLALSTLPGVDHVQDAQQRASRTDSDHNQLLDLLSELG